MKKILAILTIIISTASFSAFAESLPSPQSSLKPLDSIVAVVNNEVITKAQFEQAMTIAKMQIARSHMMTPPAGTLRQEVLNQLINVKLQLQIAKRNNFKVSDAEVAEAFSSLAKRNHLTLAQLKQKLHAQGHSITELKKQIRKQLIVQQVLREAVAKKVKVTDKEVDQFIAKYNQHNQGQQRIHLVDLVIPIADNSNQAEVAAAKKEAQSIAKQLQAGKSLKSVHQAHANLEVNDFGWRAAADLPDLFLKPIATMQDDSYSNAIAAPNGFHILKLIGKQAAATQGITRARAQQVLFQQKFMQQSAKFIKQLRKTAYIKIMNND